MSLSYRSEEILESMWVEVVEKDNTWANATHFADDEALRELDENGCVKRTDNQVALTQAGHEEARGCIRRHRLAERLLTDVLRVKKGMVHEASCDFEHALHRGVDENVCTLLGHPRHCPHGSLIPEGPCCREQRAYTEQLVTSLTALGKKKTGVVAYLRTDDRAAMQKLIAMGVLPGITVEVIQTFPTIAFQAGRSQFAIDHELAAKIMVRQCVEADSPN